MDEKEARIFHKEYDEKWQSVVRLLFGPIASEYAMVRRCEFLPMNFSLQFNNFLYNF